MRLKVEKLSKETFSSYGEVVEASGAREIPINQGYAVRRNGLATVDVAHHDGDTNISLFVAQPRPSPIVIAVMERHPDGSQLFYPLQDRDWLVVVCDHPHEPASYRAFLASGRQGVNYARNVWHHPLLVLDADSRFMVVDRAGPGANLEEIFLDTTQPLELDFGADR
jgi:ureidoglycolate lyase